MTSILYIQETSEPLGLAEACLSLTPKISCSPKGELLLDVASTQKLLGGEKGLLSRLDHIGENFQIEKTVVTDRPEWAKPLGIFTDTITDANRCRRMVIPPGESQQKLLSLKIERIPLLGELIIDEDEWKERHRLVAFMRRVGLTHIHDFAKLPPLAINRRFGRMGILLHQWTWGKRELPIPLFSPQESISDTLDVSEVSSIDALLIGLDPLLKRLGTRLDGRAELAKQIDFHFRLETGRLFTEVLKLSEPTKNSVTLLRLLNDFLRPLTWEAPLDSLKLVVTSTSPYVPVQLSLFDTVENKSHDLNKFLTQMQTRYPTGSIGFPVLRESYLPEAGWNIANKAAASTKTSLGKTPFCDRPLFIFSSPKPTTPSGKLTLCERIETQWWEELQHRTYYIESNPPETEHRWIFTTPEKRWFWHGIF